jgi:DNA-binding Lrp family transcriptional regulator
VPPYSEIAFQAAALRRALKLPPIEEPGKQVLEMRAWPPFQHSVRVLKDSFESELLRFHEAHQQLNAIGRCRPLSRAPNPTLVLLLAGRPFDGVSPVCKPIADVLAAFGISIKLPTKADCDDDLEAYNERLAVKVIDRQDRLLSLLLEHGPLSQRQLSQRLGVPASTVRRDLIELQAVGALGATAAANCLVISIPRAKLGNAPIEWPTIDQIASTLRSVGARVQSRNTTRSCLRALVAAVERAPCSVPVPLPARRSDQAEHLQAVVEAVARILSERIAAAQLSTVTLEPPVLVQVRSTSKDGELWYVLPPIDDGARDDDESQQGDLFSERSVG